MAWPFKGKPGKINIIRDSPDPGTWIRAQVTYRYTLLSGILLILGLGSELRLHTGLEYYLRLLLIQEHGSESMLHTGIEYYLRLLLIQEHGSESMLHTSIEYYLRLLLFSVLGIFFDWF